MKRRIASLLVAIPLVAGGICLAEDNMMDKHDSKMMTDKHEQKMIIKRASQIIGKDVYNQEGKEIGSIKDIVLDGGTNRISYAVVSYGGVLGMGDKLFAVPWRALEMRSIEPDKLFLMLDSAMLKDSPGFDEKNWPDMANSTLRDQINRFYADHDAHRDQIEKKQMTQKPADMKMAEKPGPEEKGLLWCRRVSAVLGADVRNPANENLGAIDDLVIDAHTGSVQYAVLSFGGVLGVGDKLFAIPYASLQTKADDEKFVLNVDKDRLKAAPGFDKKNWPDFADPQFRNSVDDYYSGRADARTK